MTPTKEPTNLQVLFISGCMIIAGLVITTTLAALFELMNKDGWTTTGFWRLCKMFGIFIALPVAYYITVTLATSPKTWLGKLGKILAAIMACWLIVIVPYALIMGLIQLYEWSPFWCSMFIGMTAYVGIFAYHLELLGRFFTPSSNEPLPPSSQSSDAPENLPSRDRP